MPTTLKIKGTNYGRVTDVPAVDLLGPSTLGWAVTPSGTPFPQGTARWVTISGSGTITYTDIYGASQVTGVLPIGRHDLLCNAITAATATGITAWL